MNDYPLKELMPIVAKLAEGYVSKESTSIPYEKAEQLIDAVLYCIHEITSANKNQTSDMELLQPFFENNQNITIEDMYINGYKIVIEKVKNTQLLFNEMISSFNSYGNENYQDTVTRAIPGFFRLYDVRFAPQDTVITMDYPVLGGPYTDEGKSITGIDAIKKYVEDISLEQLFLGRFPENYVIDVLYEFQKDYKKQFYNICEIILRHVLANLLINANPDDTDTAKKHIKILETLRNMTKTELRQKLTCILEIFITEQYSDNHKLYDYLNRDTDEYSDRLLFGVKHDCMRQIVVL